MSTFKGSSGSSTVDLGISSHHLPVSRSVTVHRPDYLRETSDHAPVSFVLDMPLVMEFVKRISKALYADAAIRAQCIDSYERSMPHIFTRLQSSQSNSELDDAYEVMTTAFKSPWALHVKRIPGKFKTVHKPGLSKLRRNK